MAAALVTALPVAAQPMGRMMMPRPPGTMQNSRPNMPLNMAAFPQSVGGFGHMPFGMMMSHPGMQGQGGYGMGSMGSYGGGMMGSPYGPPSGAGPQLAGYDMGRQERSSEEKALNSVLRTVGLPSEHGQLEWPVGLRALPGAEDLRRQIDALVHDETEQATVGPTNAQLDKELARSVKGLRNLLLRDKEERFSLPLAAYEDAERFLAKLDHADQLLKAGVESPGEKARLESREAIANEVGIADDRFDQPTLTVPVGTTVRWTNHGEHKHTVTSDSGDWGSKELGPGDRYSYTFSQPGTYLYHCDVHPKEMRGTVVVK
jgi:plastocyanin